jgi:hypothetical protein
MKKIITLSSLIFLFNLCNLSASSSTVFYSQQENTKAVQAHELDDVYEKLAKVARKENKGIYVALQNSKGDTFGKYRPSTFEVDKFRTIVFKEIHNPNSSYRVQVMTPNGHLLGFIVVADDTKILSYEEITEIYQ